MLADQRRIEPAATESASHAVGIAPNRNDVEHGEARLMQSVNPVLPETGFAVERAFAAAAGDRCIFRRASRRGAGVEHVALDDARGTRAREPIVADADYPAAARSLMDGFALRAQATPGAFEIAGDVRMGSAPGARPRRRFREPDSDRRRAAGRRRRGRTVEEARVATAALGRLAESLKARTSSSAAPTCAAASRSSPPAGAFARREIGVLATLGVTSVPVYRRPVIAVFSSGDELIDAVRGAASRGRFAIRIATPSPRRCERWGRRPRHYPTLRDEADEFDWRSLASDFANATPSS